MFFYIYVITNFNIRSFLYFKLIHHKYKFFILNNYKSILNQEFFKFFFTRQLHIKKYQNLIIYYSKFIQVFLLLLLFVPINLNLFYTEVLSKLIPIILGHKFEVNEGLISYK
jgi:hypothetical protein